MIAVVVTLLVGLQASEGLHDRRESHGQHRQKHAEDPLRQKVRGHHHALSTRGEWRGMYV